MKKIGLINGPNLNMLGVREPEIYGNTSLQDIEEMMTEYCNKSGFELVCEQSNSEGKIINIIQSMNNEVEVIIVNPGGYTHTSVAISDAIKSIDTPVIEVHISNIFNREDYRKISVTASGTAGVITGFGIDSYLIALDAAFKKCK